MIQFDDTYATELEGLYVPWQGERAPAPAIVQLNRELAQELGLDADALSSPEGAALLTGSDAPEGARPLAQAYAGHQFGGFSPQLGDGRALLVGELIDTRGRRRDLHLKGSGRTPFSRGGDGKATLGPVLREYLIGEFMHAVGIPTTRSLAATTTGETVEREEPLPGAVLARVASSHIRVGTFQFFAARGEAEKLRRLADYTIRRHFPELVGGDDPYLGLLHAVIDRQASLVARWVGVGFVHGVMNTDNTTVSGETIDYGPCAFIDHYDARAVFSSIDHGGRYAYGNQASIAQWNLARFAETLLDLLAPSDPEQALRTATEAVEGFAQLYEEYWLAQMRAKLGLGGSAGDERALIRELHSALDTRPVDFTQLFRALAQALRGEEGPARELFGGSASLEAWLDRWLARQRDQDDTPEQRAAAMDRVNPVYVPRNHKVEEALQAAIRGDLDPFESLLRRLEAPYTVARGHEDLAAPAPAGFGPYTTYCGT